MGGRDQILDTPEQHAAHYLAFAERVRAESFGPRRNAVYDDAERECRHLCTALKYLLERADGERAERMVRALPNFWWARGRPEEGRRWVARVLAMPKLPDPTRAALLDHAGALAFGIGAHDAARSYFEESLAIRRQDIHPAAWLLLVVLIGRRSYRRRRHGDEPCRLACCPERRLHRLEGTVDDQQVGARHSVCRVLSIPIEAF